MTYKLNVGDTLPSFEALDQSGAGFSSQNLKGQPAVIYFYPKDDTPGCTKEACAFRDELEGFKELNIRIIGISPDSVKSHQKFMTKYNLNFTLLADPDKVLANLFDVIQMKSLFGVTKPGVERTTFLIDQKGKIRWIERPVTVDGHINRVKEAAKSL